MPKQVTEEEMQKIIAMKRQYAEEFSKASNATPPQPHPQGASDNRAAVDNTHSQTNCQKNSIASVLHAIAIVIWVIGVLGSACSAAILLYEGNGLLAIAVGFAAIIVMLLLGLAFLALSEIISLLNEIARK